MRDALETRRSHAEGFGETRDFGKESSNGVWFSHEPVKHGVVTARFGRARSADRRTASSGQFRGLGGGIASSCSTSLDETESASIGRILAGLDT